MLSCKKDRTLWRALNVHVLIWHDTNGKCIQPEYFRTRCCWFFLYMDPYWEFVLQCLTQGLNPDLSGNETKRRINNRKGTSIRKSRTKTRTKAGLHAFRVKSTCPWGEAFNACLKENTKAWFGYLLKCQFFVEVHSFRCMCL